MKWELNFPIHLVFQERNTFSKRLLVYAMVSSFGGILKDNEKTPTEKTLQEDSCVA